MMEPSPEAASRGSVTNGAPRPELPNEDARTRAMRRNLERLLARGAPSAAPLAADPEEAPWQHQSVAQLEPVRPATPSARAKPLPRRRPRSLGRLAAASILIGLLGGAGAWLAVALIG